ncbi:MAG TPA: hypothetical protein VMB84_14270 [Stellaceae bacterium]|nr:hypothetical protein [Stellaceae bacterium]
MRRAIGIVVGCLLVLIFAAPFVRDGIAWYRIRTTYAMDPAEQKAYQSWMGSPGSFVAMLRGHCLERNAGNSQACTAYE